MKTKRFWAILLTLSMMFSVANSALAEVGNPTTAESTYLVDNFTARPKISLVYMQPKADYSGSGFAYEETTAPSNMAAGDTFYVGVKYENFQQYKTVGTGNNGLFSFSASILFNKNIVVPEPTLLDGAGVSINDDWESVINSAGGGDVYADSLKERINVTGSYFKKNGFTYAGFATDAVMFKDPAAGDNQGIDNAKLIGLATSYASSTATPSWKDDSFITAIYEFRLKSVPAAGTKLFDILAKPTDLTISFGVGGATANYKYGNGLDADLAGFTDLDVSALDLFPADQETLTSIAVAGAPTLSYVAGDKFDPTVSSGTSLSVTPTTSEGEQAAISPTKTDYKGLKFYVAAADNLGDDMSTATEISTSTQFTVADHNDKYVYVAYTVGGVTKAQCLGQLEVVAKSVSKLEIQSTGDNATTFGTGTYYTTTKVTDVLTRTTDPEKLTAKITYNNDDTEDVAYADFTSKGLALAKVGAESKLVAVSATDTFAEGVNTFYVVQTGNIGKTLAEITDTNLKPAITTTSVTKDTIVIKSIANAKLAYATAEDTAGDKKNVIDFSTADITTYSKSVGDHDNTNTTQKVSALGTDKLIFYVGTSNVPTENAYGDGSGKTTITSGTTTYTSDLKNKYVFVVPADDTAATPVLVGQLKNRAISTSTTDIGTGYEVTGITTNANTQYGDKLGNGAKIAVKYDNGDTKELSYSDFATEGITMKIVKADGTTEVVASATDQTVLTPAMNGGFVQFFYNGTKIGTSTPLTVNKKTVGYSSDANIYTPSVTKEYDGTTKLAESDKAKVEFKIDESDLEAADNLSGKLEITGVTYSYNNKNVAIEKDIVASETSQGSLAVNGSTDDVNKFNANYTLASLTPNTTVYNRGCITAKTLNVTTITGVPSVEVGATTGLTGTSTLTLKNNDTTDTNSNIVKDDVVTLTYKYEYKAADVKAVGTPDVTITATGTEGSTQLGLSGTDAGNYKLGTLPTTKGTVVNKKLNTITINTAPTKATYTYPDTKLDLTGIKFNLNYEGATTATTIDLAQFITDGGIITLTDAAGQSQTITADNAAGKISLPYGETTLNITYGGKNTTTKVTTNKKPIKLSEITFAASKVYGQDDAAATKTATPPTGAIEAADADAVQFTFDAKFADESAGENKNVTISNVKLVKKGEGTTDPSVNYVIVKDNGDPIAETDTTTIDTGVISQGAQTAPAKPTVKVDSATNNIIVEGPLGENIEYSIDGGQTWQSDVTFTGLTKGTNYTVQARVKATADGNYAPSEPTASEPVTTFKYYVAVYKKNAKEGSEPAYKVYTNTTSAASKADLNALLPKKISNLKEFYTDAPATIKVEYPYTLAAENVLYYTTSGGGGGGTGSSVTITLDKTSVSGEVGDSEKVTATIKGSTATPKWTSSDEKVATVDQNGNITFVGEGKATVKINVSGTVKSVAVTVTAAKATPVPTVEPTVEPTDKPSEPDKPIIDVNYTKPYASGYEDDTFRPENKITRAELAAMIARLSYGDDLPDGAYVSSFPDVEADAWFNKYVGYLEDKDVLNGYEDGTFRPYDTVTRGEISTVIARAQRYELITYSGIFADVTDSDWAKDYIQTLAAQGIISGYEDGTFGPYSPLSRAEAVTIINNVLAPSTPIVTFTPNDIAGHWAEANIILAVNERMLGGAAVPVPVPEDTAPEATEVPAEEVVPEGELDPTVKDEPAVPVNPEAGAVTDEEQKFIVK